MRTKSKAGSYSLNGVTVPEIIHELIAIQELTRGDDTLKDFTNHLSAAIASLQQARRLAYEEWVSAQEENQPQTRKKSQRTPLQH